MFQKCFLPFFLLFGAVLLAQKIETPYKNLKIAYSTDTVFVDKVSINRAFFKILDKNGTPIDTSFYKIDFKTAKLVFKKKIESTDSVSVRYLKFPDFLDRKSVV